MMKLTLAQALNKALEDSMKEDPKVILSGEDIGRLGGVFRVTDGLQEKFGAERVQDSPLGESGIVGTAIGLAMNGWKPVVEIQFDGFVFTAFNQITSMLAKMNYRSGGALGLPVVVRIPYGGGIGAIEHHSESPEAYFTHTPGLKVVTPSDPQGAYSLMRWAVESPDPVIFLEPKSSYWEKGEVSTGQIGAPEVTKVRSGDDVTIVSYGPSVKTCQASAQEAEEYGIGFDIFDLQALSPLNLGEVYDSVRRTGRCVVVHEAAVSGGVGAEVAARIQEQCFYSLEAPVLRVGGWFTPYPVSKLEKDYLPSEERILDAVLRSMKA